MAPWHERLDGFLGRMLFRFFGLLCALLALVLARAAWWHVRNWGPDVPLYPAFLFGLAAIAAASCVLYCFSRRRRLVEALDAMEEGVGDRTRRP